MFYLYFLFKFNDLNLQKIHLHFLKIYPMSNQLVRISDLTESDIQKQKDYHHKRNLYVKYTPEQLENWTKVDLYEALDLEHLRDQEIPNDLLNYSIKRKSSVYHPTKNRGRQEAFLLLKKAQTVFSNPRFRKVYDSCFLDENIPEDKEYELEDFLNAFEVVFDRNGLFSEIKPVPSIRGDVETFYKFWQNFKTTRVYDDPNDIFDVNGSSRRYAAEKNKEILQNKKLKDLIRIQSLVKLAIKRDPRIKKKSLDSSPWDENQLKSLSRFDSLFGKTANKYDVIAKKLNDLFLTKRTPNEIKNKIEEQKKK